LSPRLRTVVLTNMSLILKRTTTQVQDVSPLQFGPDLLHLGVNSQVSLVWPHEKCAHPPKSGQRTRKRQEFQRRRPRIGNDFPATAVIDCATAKPSRAMSMNLARASNENQSCQVRFWLPKGSRLDDVKPEELAAITNVLNHQPRRMFEWERSAKRYAAAARTVR
jgi:hypothetical protein